MMLNIQEYHGGNSKGYTCVVDRDVTAYLSTEYYGSRPSSTAVDTGDTRGLMMSKLFFRHILLFYFQNLFLGYFSFLRKA